MAGKNNRVEIANIGQGMSNKEVPTTFRFPKGPTGFSVDFMSKKNPPALTGGFSWMLETNCLDLAGAKFAEDARQQARSCKLYRKRLVTQQIRQNRRPRRVNNLEKICCVFC
jgi:hypothetical protein